MSNKKIYVFAPLPEAMDIRLRLYDIKTFKGAYFKNYGYKSMVNEVLQTIIILILENRTN